MTATEIPDVLELEVGAIAAGGGCVGRAPDGKVVFVRHSLPGELVRAQVTASTTSYLRADAIEVLRASPDRVDPPAPTPDPGAAAAATSNTWRSGPSGGSRPSESPSNWNASPG